MADGVRWIDAGRAGVQSSRRGDELAQGVTDGVMACPATICRPVGVLACRRAWCGLLRAGGGDKRGRGLSACRCPMAWR